MINATPDLPSTIKITPKWILNKKQCAMYDQSYKTITNLCSSKQHILFQKIKWVLLNSYQDQYGAEILRCLLYQIGKNDRRKCKEMLANGFHSINTNSLKNQHQHKF